MPTRKLVLGALTAALSLPAIASSTAAQGEAATAPSGTYAVSERIPAADGGWDFANVDAANAKLYIARSNAITVVDLASRKVTDRLAEAHRGHQVLAIDGGRTLFETDGETGLGRFIDTGSGAVLAQVPAGRKPDAAFADPHTGLIAVMNAGDGTIALIDPASRSLAGRIDVGGGLEFGVADGQGGAFVNIEDANVIAKIDLVNRKRTGTFALPGCEGPTGLALVAHGTRLISACANKVALVLDAASGAVVSRLTIGSDPDAVLADEARGLAFIPCGGSGTLVQLATADPDHIGVLATIPTQVGAKTGAVDPRDGRIYLPTATLAPPEPGAKRGKPVPGSFVVLVVSPAQ